MLIRIFIPWIILIGILGLAGGASLFSEPSNCFQYGAQSSQHASSPNNPVPNIAGGNHQDNAERDCRPWWGPEWTLVWVTIGLVLITGTLAVYTGLLWRSTRDLVTDAGNSSKAQLRAYVHPDSLGVMDGSAFNPPQMNRINQPGINLQWRNTGETPAKNVVVWMRVAVMKIQNENRINAPESLELHFPNTLGRGIPGTRSIWYRRQLTAQQAAAVTAGRLGIYVYGRIEYQDIFGRSHWTRFKYVYTNSAFPPIGSGSFNICQSGNDTDSDQN